uniref:C2orf72-like C-terminal domain-containing protein n=1 Tax=Terrapene triunguis TaxID=2587831 RepID=A0A674J7Q2_9SAUR
MEPQEQSGRADAAEPGASPDGEFQAVVQRTQVLLLAGETWEPERAQAALSSFAHEVLPVARRPPSPAPPSAPPAGQLIFFLCRASSLRGRAERLREVLRGVREQSRGAPAALVGVIVQPRPEEEAEARRRLEELLLEVFQPPGPGAAPRVEVHTAVFRPGRPEGALEVKKAACEAVREELVPVEPGHGTENPTGLSAPSLLSAAPHSLSAGLPCRMCCLFLSPACSSQEPGQAESLGCCKRNRSTCGTVETNRFIRA